jgi:hypothetical protein
MKSFNDSYQEDTSDGFFCVEVLDLDASLVAGGAFAGVNADAYAAGNSSFAWTNTNTNARQLANGGSIAIGQGTAVASGNNSSTNVNVFGSGDAYLAYTSTTNSSTTRNSVRNSTSQSTGFVIAMDNP